MILTDFDKHHLAKWLSHYAPIDRWQLDETFDAMVKWMESSDDAEMAYNQGWTRVFELSGPFPFQISD